MIAQTVQFTGTSPETLYTAYVSSREHSAMTAGSRPAFFFRPSVGEVAHGQEGDELRAFVNTHWNLLYWEPMRAYFQKGEVSA